MTNTPDKSEMLPCPFPHEVKRGVFVEVDTVDFGFARVSCSDCGCAGPYVTLANHERATKAEKAEAIAAWNTRSRPADQVPDMDRAREILNRHTEYMDGLARGQVTMKTSNALAAVEEALASAAIPSAGGVEKMREALKSICRETGRNADGMIDWQRCVDRIQNIARAALGKDASDE